MPSLKTAQGSLRNPLGLARSTALMVVLAVAAGGCSLSARHAPEDARAQVADIPRDYRQRHPIAITESERSVEIFVGARRGGLNATQRSEIAALVREWRREATGGLVVEVPTGTPNARAAADAAREIRSVLSAAGVPARAMAQRSYRPGDPSQLATIKVSYPRMTAHAGPCGMWPEDLGLTHDSRPFENRQYWNFGCANQRNLAAMVATPSDLVEPRAEAPVYAGRRSTVLDTYRRGESTATKYPDLTRGAISEVGR